MWHEARKQERKIRGMLVDYRKRAERRRDFYEKIKADPTQFLQIHGRQCKIHLDPAVATAAEGPATMMPWQGNNENLIDRFDVRAHLDMIPKVTNLDAEEATYEERQVNYERYRIVAQNAFLGIHEEKFLKQLHLEEQFGYTENEPKKKKPTGGAAIGFNYEDGTGTSTFAPAAPAPEEDASEDNSDSDLDVDLSINIAKIDSAQAHEMNRHGRNFGMSSNDFYSFLTNDLEEAESFKLAKEEEHEKALYSGRKSRRERRARRETRLVYRKISPPSYAAKESPTFKLDMHEKSESRSPSPQNTGKITFITSFGDEEEPQMPVKPTYADKVKYGAKLKRLWRGSDERYMFVGSKVDKASNSKELLQFKRKAPRDNRRSSSKTRKMRERRSFSSFTSKSQSRSRSRSPPRSTTRRRRRSRRSSSCSSDQRRSSRSKRQKSRSRSRSSSRSRSRSRSAPRIRNKRCSSSSSSSSKSSKSRSPSPTKMQVSPVRKSRSPLPSPSTENAHCSRSLPPKLVIFGHKIEKDKEKEREIFNDDVKVTEKCDELKPLPRYYGRRKSDQSSSELCDSSDDYDDSKSGQPNTQSSSLDFKTGNSGTTTKATSKPNMSLAERLKRKRQAQLNKQFKLDKIAELMNLAREKQEQQTREDELRELALKLRKKHIERRHAYDSDSSLSTSSSSSSSSSPKTKKSRTPSPKDDKRHHRPRDRDRDYKHRSDREEEYKRSYRDNSREKERERERDRERDKDRNRHRRSRSPRYDERRNEDKYHRDERRRDSQYKDKDRERERSDSDYQNQKEKDRIAVAKSLVDY